MIVWRINGGKRKTNGGLVECIHPWTDSGLTCDPGSSAHLQSFYERVWKDHGLSQAVVHPITSWCVRAALTGQGKQSFLPPLPQDLLCEALSRPVRLFTDLLRARLSLWTDTDELMRIAGIFQGFHIFCTLPHLLHTDCLLWHKTLQLIINNNNWINIGWLFCLSQMDGWMGRWMMDGQMDGSSQTSDT